MRRPCHLLTGLLVNISSSDAGDPIVLASTIDGFAKFRSLLSSQLPTRHGFALIVVLQRLRQ